MSEFSTFQTCVVDHSCALQFLTLAVLLCVRLQLYDLVELKISGDGNCQVGSLDISAPLSSQYGMF